MKTKGKNLQKTQIKSYINNIYAFFLFIFVAPQSNKLHGFQLFTVRSFVYLFLRFKLFKFGFCHAMV